MVSASLKREMERNIHGEQVAIAMYFTFERNLRAVGLKADANLIAHIRKQEEHHLEELRTRKRAWAKAI